MKPIEVHYNNRNDIHNYTGPAIIWENGDCEWYVNGRQHRLMGPAVECANGNKFFYIEGKAYSEDAYWKIMYEYGLITKQEAFLHLL